jgi:acetate kinase
MAEKGPSRHATAVWIGVLTGRGRTVVLHLGNGSGECAIARGRSVAGTMGFTAADGLPQEARSLPGRRRDVRSIRFTTSTAA